MPTIKIKGQEHSYNEDQVIAFPEGLVGLSDLRRAVVIPIDEFQPFCWLAPLENDELRFVIVDPNDIFDGYAPPQAVTGQKTYAIVTLFSDWTRTTFNLKAPIMIDERERTAYQIILNDSQYTFAEALPQN
jgi:flagellar assembly factor FliW